MKNLIVFFISILFVFNFAQAKRSTDIDSTKKSDSKERVAIPGSLQFFMDCLKVSTSIACNKIWNERNASNKMKPADYEALRVGLVKQYQVETLPASKAKYKELLKILDGKQKKSIKSVESIQESESAS